MSTIIEYPFSIRTKTGTHKTTTLHAGQPDSPSLLLLSGYSVPHRDLSRLVRRLGNHFDVSLFDCAQPEYYRPERMLEQMVAAASSYVEAHYPNKPYHAAGFSTGCAIILELTRTPHPPESLVLTSSAIPNNPYHPEKIAARALGGMLRATLVSTKKLATARSALDLVRKIARYPLASRRFAQEIGTYTPPSHVSQPTLIIHGSCDELEPWSPTVDKTYRNMNPDAVVQLIEPAPGISAGHALPITNPDVVFRHMQKFYADKGIH